MRRFINEHPTDRPTIPRGFPARSQLPSEQRQSLANGARSGIDEFRSFYEAKYDTVLKAAFAFCGDRELSRDATQEAFSRALARWRTIKLEPWKESWTLTTALNFIRRTKRRERTEKESLIRPQSPTAGNDVDSDRVDILRALRSLPPRQRQTVVLFYFVDAPISEIAHLMNVSEGTVKKNLFRARQALEPTLRQTR